MQTFEKLNSAQKTVLLVILGVVSVIALHGLSQTSEHYYVSAALSRAFFSGTLMLVLAYPILIYLGKKQTLRKLEDSNKAKSIGGLPLVIFLIAIIVISALIIISQVSSSKSVYPERGRSIYVGRGR